MTSTSDGDDAGAEETTADERLSQLDELRDQGIVTDAEYAERRQEILDSEGGGERKRAEE
jgi:hypothetical protein